ncbi:MAG TPA: ABC transporter permease [Myxococcaceae bacterium]|nr:ABC transporter permease [Myxococcaceae bacterium]
MNAVGMKTLLYKEVARFMRVPGQTVLAPLISTSLYFVVFGSLAGSLRTVEGVPYLRFIVPGLVFMGIANNAFLNSSSSLFITKIQGTIVDLLAAPLGPAELLFGFITGAMIRGLAVGLLIWLVSALFTDFSLAHPLVAVGVLLLVSYTFAMLGLLAAVWAEKFEQINFFPTFVMVPLTFLGGVFYSVKTLPPPWNTISLLNPMVYMAELMRFGFLDRTAFSPVVGGAVLLALSLVSTGVAVAALRSGYKLKQ